MNNQSPSYQAVIPIYVPTMMGKGAPIHSPGYPAANIFSSLFNTSTVYSVYRCTYTTPLQMNPKIKKLADLQRVPCNHYSDAVGCSRNSYSAEENNYN